MDEFAEYVYQRRPEYRHLSTGDISAQKELRKHLKCKDFKWFMAAVAWDVPKYFPPVEPPPASWGEVRNILKSRIQPNLIFIQNSQIYSYAFSAKPLWPWYSFHKISFNFHGQWLGLWNYLRINCWLVKLFHLFHHHLSYIHKNVLPSLIFCPIWHFKKNIFTKYKA